MGNIIELRNINKSFYGSRVLNEMSLVIEEGEVRSLIGENGCGKSTLIKIISGFYTFDDGELIINGKAYKKITPIEAMREGIQVVYQDFSLYHNLSVAENIMMNVNVQGKSRLMHWKETRQKAEEILKKIGVDINPRQLVEELNMASKQIVAICRALVQNAKLIIMDEPTSALTYREIQELFRIVSDLTKQGIAVLFVSHKLEEVMNISQNVTIMRNGKNVFDGDVRDLDKSKMIYYMTGRELSDAHYEYPEEKESVMSVKNLSLSGCFRDISFDLHKGEILGITGLLGCGRSELAKSLFGMMPADSGQIFLEGREVQIKSASEAVHAGIGYVPEDRIRDGLHMPRNIDENAIACVTEELRNKWKLLDMKKVQDRKVSALGRFSIGGLAFDKPVRALSGGNQQKVLLIKWLEIHPKVLILDCPTVGVDVGSRDDIHGIIRDLAKDGMSLIVISDDIPEIMQVCNRTFVMHEGRFISEVRTEDTSAKELEDMLIQHTKVS